MSKIFISPGDPSGIGPEITLKALNKNKQIQHKFIIGGDANYFEDFSKVLNLDLKFIEEESSGEGINIKHFPLKKDVILGKPDVVNSSYIIDILSFGSLGSLSKKYKGLVTGPINKELINASGYAFSGHTEFLSEICNKKKSCHVADE